MAAIRGWAPFVALLVAYEAMRDAAALVGAQPHNLAVFDRRLFDGYEPTLVLQAAAAQLSDPDLLEDAGSLVYGAHFLLPVMIGIWLWTRDRDSFNRFGFTLVILCAMAFATYVVAPTSPPWLAQPASVRHVTEDAIQKSGLPASLLWLYSNHDYNLYAAFPSLHAGFPVVAAYAAWQRHRFAGVLLAAWAAVVWIAVVYLGEHYVTDVLGGIAYAVTAILVVHLLTRRGPRAPSPVLGGRTVAPSPPRPVGTTRSRS